MPAYADLSVPRPKPLDPTGPSSGQRRAGPLGPRPLALHLHLAWLDAVARSSDAFADGPGGVDAAAKGRLLEALAGLRAYWHHPRREAAAAGSGVWEEGARPVLDLGQAGGQPLPLLPSLIQRAHLLDPPQGRPPVPPLAQAGLRAPPPRL